MMQPAIMNTLLFLACVLVGALVSSCGRRNSR